jgi:Helix-turn-helix domain
MQRKLPLCELADKTVLSVSRLCHLFRNQTGMSPRRYLKLARLAKAKELLEASAFSVKVSIKFKWRVVCSWSRRATGEPMTYRIDRLSTEQGLVLCISGRLAEEDLELVRMALDGRRVVAIDLAEIELVGRDAVKVLVRAESEGIELRSCPAYIREWITNERDSS